MTFYLNDEPIRRADDVELEGVDISDLKVWKDETFTAEVDTSGWSKEHWRAIFGFIPIIRCKDCKHHGEQYGNGYCMKDGCYGWDDEDYCSRAERK